jgi:hypothetical protein
VRWARIGAQSPDGHLETRFLAAGASADDARRMVEALPLASVKTLLEEEIAQRARGAAPSRRWWDAMRDDDGAM